MDQASLEEQSCKDDGFKAEDKLVDEDASLLKKALEANEDPNTGEIPKKDETPREEANISKEAHNVRSGEEADKGASEDLKELVENSGESSIDSNIEILNRDEVTLEDSQANDENKENENRSKIKMVNHGGDLKQQEPKKPEDKFDEHEPLLPNLSLNNLSYLDRSIDRSKTSIDDLSFSQKTLIKSCSLRSLITDLINDEILLDKNELSKDLDEFEKEKFFQIIKIIKQEDSEKRVEQLKELCITEKGLILSDLRRIVWPIITSSAHINPNHAPDRETITNHPMYSQVIQDVNRTIKRFPPSIEREERLSKEKQLTDLIMRILIENPEFHYYQGYHDICITFLLLLGEEKAFHVVNKVSNTHLRRFMEESMSSTQLLLEVIPILVENEDKPLAKLLAKVEVGTIFSLSWILTWFSHILVNNRNVERLFDIFIASDYRLPIYFTACILLHHRELILAKEQDLAVIFQCLAGLLDQEDQFPFETLLRQALELMDKYPPETLVDEQRRRMSVQREREEQLRSLYAAKKVRRDQSGQLLTAIKNNKTLLIASAVVALSAVSYQIYKSSST